MCKNLNQIIHKQFFGSVIVALFLYEIHINVAMSKCGKNSRILLNN